MDLSDITGTSLLSIYLNDHLAGSAAGLALIGRSAEAHRGAPAGPPLAKIAVEIEEDRDSLLGFMAALEVDVQQYKLAGAWLVERIGRLKPNGYLLSRSPLSSVVELEGMLIGVTGKEAGWRSLRTLADTEPRLDAAKLDRLIERAQQQAATLEELRRAAAEEAFSSPPA